MLRQRLTLVSQSQSLRGIGRKALYPLLRPLCIGPSLPTPDDPSSRKVLAIVATDARNKICYKSGTTQERQSTHAGPCAAPPFEKRAPMRVLQAYIAFALILSLLYEPLRDDGVFGAIADSTIFRVISPKLVEPPDCADETIYKPISREKEIRLLVLEPGGPGDELKCHLIHAQLSWRTRYEALSYVWGDGTVTRPLSCSGRTETVHINLHDALSDLRLSNRERILWTDRLCIHQSHDGEKTTQIKLMGDIYSQASQVLIYLGKMDSSVEGAMKYIFQDRSAYKIPDRAAVIINLLRRPWFQRTWVFQEAVLAKRAQVICGQQSVPWTILEGLVQSMTIEQTFGRDIPAYRSMDRIVSGVFLMTAVRSARHLEWTTFCRIFGCIVSQGLVDQELFSRLVRKPAWSCLT